MVPMIDAMAMAPGAMDAVLSIGPGFVVVLVAAIAGAVWLAHRTTEELRRTAARDWEERRGRTTPTRRGRLAA